MASQPDPMHCAQGPFRTKGQTAQTASDAAVLANIEKVAGGGGEDFCTGRAGKCWHQGPGVPTVTAAPPAVGQTPVPVHTPARIPLAQAKFIKVNQGDNVRAWLRESEMYCLLAEVPQKRWAILATAYLEGTPRDLWEIEIAADKVAGEFDMTHLPTFQAYTIVMLRYYDTFLPAHTCTARKECDVISQETTRAAFLREPASMTHELRDKAFKPSQGDVILNSKILNGLKSATRKYCEDNAPEDWWIERDPFVEKSLHHE